MKRWADLAEEIGPSTKDEAIVNSLDNDNHFVKKAAACALKNFGALAKDAIHILRRNLVPSDHDTAWCSAEAFGAMGGPAREAVPDLLKVIKDDEGHFSIDRKSISEFA